MKKMASKLTSGRRKPKLAEAKDKPTDVSTKSTKSSVSKKKKKKKYKGATFYVERPDRLKESWATMHTWSESGEKNAEEFMKCFSEMGVDAIKAEFHSEVEPFKSSTYSDTAFQANPTKNVKQTLMACLDESRVLLSGNQYINASWAYDAKNLDRKYIIAEVPLENTLEDFWQMAYEQKAACVFALCDSGGNRKESTPADSTPPSPPPQPHSSIQLFPNKEGQTLIFGKMEVHNRRWSNLDSWRGSELEVGRKGALDKDKHFMRVLHIAVWETPCTQKTGSKMNDLLHDMALIEGEHRFGDLDKEKGPMVLMDDYSGTSRAAALVIADVMGSLLYKGEQNVTLPAIVKWARRCRHGAIRNEDEYLLIVRTIAQCIYHLDNRKYGQQYEKLFGKYIG